jgi:hypothetical protein
MPFFKRTHKVTVALAVKEILDEQLGKKLIHIMQNDGSLETAICL